MHRVEAISFKIGNNKKMLRYINIINNSILLLKRLLAIALGGAVSSLISCFVNASPNKKLLNYSYLEQMKDLFPSMGIAAIMGIIVYGISFLALPSLLKLIIQVLLGVIIYVGLAWIFKLECFIYLKNIILGFLKNRKKA